MPAGDALDPDEIAGAEVLDTRGVESAMRAGILPLSVHRLAQTGWLIHSDA
jgi:hypothetical protein